MSHADKLFSSHFFGTIGLDEKKIYFCCVCFVFLAKHTHVLSRGGSALREDYKKRFCLSDRVLGMWLGSN